MDVPREHHPDGRLNRAIRLARRRRARGVGVVGENNHDRNRPDDHDSDGVPVRSVRRRGPQPRAALVGHGLAELASLESGFVVPQTAQCVSQNVQMIPHVIACSNVGQNGELRTVSVQHSSVRVDECLGVRRIGQSLTKEAGSSSSIGGSSTLFDSVNADVCTEADGVVEDCAGISPFGASATETGVDGVAVGGGVQTVCNNVGEHKRTCFGPSRFGGLDRCCPFCDALMWDRERLNPSKKTDNPTFSLCCQEGGPRFRKL